MTDNQQEVIDNPNEENQETVETTDNNSLLNNPKSLVDEPVLDKPEGLSDDFWDSEKKEIKNQDLIKAYNEEKEKALGLRRKISEKGSIKPPKSIDEYIVDEKVEEFTPSDAPAMKIMKEKALEAGLSKDQFNDFVSSIIPDMYEQGIIANKQEDLNEEQQKEVFLEYKQKELEKLGKEGPQVLQKVENWGKGMVNNGVLSKDELPVFESFVGNAESLVVLNKIMGAFTNEPTIPVATAVKDGLPSRAEIDQIIGSEAYNNGDPKLQETVRKYFEATT